MIKLTLPDEDGGTAIWVNPNHILSCERLTTNDQTFINFVAPYYDSAAGAMNTQQFVTETPEQITAAIRQWHRDVR